MMNATAAVQHLRERAGDRLPELERLTRAPEIAWPTVLVMLGSLSIIVVTDVAGVMGAIPLWAGAIINGLAGYWMFTPAHDAFHRSVSKNPTLNDGVGKLGLFAISPMVSMHLFRWGHFMHHRNATGEIDPDQWTFQGPKWLLPLKWAFIDIGYLRYSLAAKEPIAKEYLKKTYVASAGWLAAIAVFTYFGYGLHVLMLWFIPTRITFALLGFAFFYLPHLPHRYTQDENATAATTVRIGSEWLMTPLLQFHNYHMIHHLFPSTPFYNNIKVWHLMEDELRKLDLAVQHDFSLLPEMVRGPEGVSSAAVRAS